MIRLGAKTSSSSSLLFDSPSMMDLIFVVFGVAFVIPSLVVGIAVACGVDGRCPTTARFFFDGKN